MTDELKGKNHLNFGLSKAEFDQLLIDLMQGDERLFEKIFVSHSTDCIKLLRSLYGIDYETAYDLTMDTLIQFRKNLIAGKFVYGNLRYLFNRMAKFCYLKKVSRKKEYSKDDIELFEVVKTEDKYDNKMLDKLKLVWSQLNEEEQELLNLHFNLGAKLIDIAQNMGVSQAAVRKRKQRIFDKIKDSLNITN